jgi:hypothetical protein
MPNGTSAPGKVFPPPLVQVRVSTIVAGSLTADETSDRFRAPAGRRDAASGLAQADRRPAAVWVQVDVRAAGALWVPRVGVAWAGLATGVGADEAAAGTVVDSPMPKTPAADSAMATGQRKTCFLLTIRFNRFIVDLPSSGWAGVPHAYTPGRLVSAHCRRVVRHVVDNDVIAIFDHRNPFRQRTPRGRPTEGQRAKGQPAEIAKIPSEPEPPGNGSVMLATVLAGLTGMVWAKT